jgi:hypothetical protein
MIHIYMSSANDSNYYTSIRSILSLILYLKTKLKD